MDLRRGHDQQEGSLSTCGKLYCQSRRRCKPVPCSLARSPADRQTDAETAATYAHVCSAPRGSFWRATRWGDRAIVGGARVTGYDGRLASWGYDIVGGLSRSWGVQSSVVSANHHPPSTIHHPRPNTGLSTLGAAGVLHIVRMLGTPRPGKGGEGGVLAACDWLLAAGLVVWAFVWARRYGWAAPTCARSLPGTLCGVVDSCSWLMGCHSRGVTRSGCVDSTTCTVLCWGVCPVADFSVWAGQLFPPAGTSSSSCSSHPYGAQLGFRHS